MEEERNADTLCNICGVNRVRKTRKKKNGKYSYSTFCNACRRKKESQYIIFKKNKCGTCGFIPIHSCQLDVDHIDGNHENNDINNLQTLCANCHRLKTLLERDTWKVVRGGKVQYKIGGNLGHTDCLRN